MPTYEYFAGGIRIDEKEFKAIAANKRPKTIWKPEGKPHEPYMWSMEYFKTNSEGNLDPEDPLLKDILGDLDLPLGKTFIIHTHWEKSDWIYFDCPSKAAAILGFW